MNRAQFDTESFPVVAPVGGFSSGVPCMVNGLLVLPQDTVTAGNQGEVLSEFHIRYSKASESVAVGDKAYWDDENGRFTKTNSGALVRVGRFTEAADAADDARVLVYAGAAADEDLFMSFEKGAATAVPVYSDVEATTQTGNGSMSVSGTGAKRAGHVKVTCTTKGVVGAAVVKFQIGDESEITGVTAAAHTQIGSTGIYCDFVDGLQGAGVDSFEVGDVFEFDVALEATSNKQHSVITMNRVTPTLITDALVLRNTRIHADSDLIVGALPVAGTRTTGTPTYAGHTCYEGYAVIQFKNGSLDAENGTSKAAITVI